jgi:hypothetical protein
MGHFFSPPFQKKHDSKFQEACHDAEGSKKEPESHNIHFVSVLLILTISLGVHSFSEVITLPTRSAFATTDGEQQDEGTSDSSDEGTSDSSDEGSTGDLSNIDEDDSNSPEEGNSDVSDDRPNSQQGDENACPVVQSMALLTLMKMVVLCLAL